MKEFARMLKRGMNIGGGKKMGKRGPTITTAPCSLCNQKPVRWGDAGCYKCGCRQYQVVEGELRPIVRRKYKRRRQVIAEGEEVGVTEGMGPDEFERLAG